MTDSDKRQLTLNIALHETVFEIDEGCVDDGWRAETGLLVPLRFNHEPLMRPGMYRGKVLDMVYRQVRQRLAGGHLARIVDLGELDDAWKLDLAAKSWRQATQGDEQGARTVVVTSAIGTGERMAERIKGLQDEGIDCTGLALFAYGLKGASTVLKNTGVEISHIWEARGVAELLENHGVAPEGYAQKVHDALNVMNGHQPRDTPP